MVGYDYICISAGDWIINTQQLTSLLSHLSPYYLFPQITPSWVIADVIQYVT